MVPKDPNRSAARDLIAFIDASPSPWHAVASAEASAAAAGSSPGVRTERWRLQAGGRHYVVRGGPR
jgi:aspartyl aminopeptidase